MTDVTVDPDHAMKLREQAVDALIADGTITSPQVEVVLRKVPRHLFVPEASLEQAYSPYNAVITKRDKYGIDMSSVSAPQIQAMMLQQAEIGPGMKVVEVGSGGLNAAYLAELVGEAGEVVSVDIDPEVVARARHLLAANGYPQVKVVLGDADEGFRAHLSSEADAILVTAGAWDISWAWFEQLAEGGRLVVPLRMRGLTRSVALRRVGGHLVSSSALICGFVPMQGVAAHQERLLLVRGTDEIGLRFDDGLPADPSLLDNAVTTPRTEIWTGVEVGRTEPIDTLQLYLATLLPGFCIMAVDAELDTGLVAPNNRSFALAAVEGGNFAYLTTRRTPDDKSVEYGVHAFGPAGPAFADTVREHVRAWAREHRGGPGPHIAVYPAGTPDDQLPGGRVIDKKDSRITISWPPAATAAEDQVAQHHSTDGTGE
ncbi:methyltransferase, FxLD system [Kitasatospora sp. NPDC088351]|uniref:methyltransferase, FxLD system n=1 Tax=unclassified Kitasatospora TaxID=2633591 RepID=UPI00344525EB